MKANTIDTQVIYRADYRQPPYIIDKVALNFDIHNDKVTVVSHLEIRTAAHLRQTEPLVLHGVGLTTKQVLLDGQPARYHCDNEEMVIDQPPFERPFTLEITVEFDPKSNKALSGLYQSGDILCTQCEAEGFRHITWYLDRPDIMAKFTVTITADRLTYPVLLSNGNLIEERELPEGRHLVTWEDPYPKPCYLFALVAGDLACVKGEFVTRSGRVVSLRFWVEHGTEDQCGHALKSLVKAMKWDEDVFGLEYDLDIYNVVAVSYFNMGAMENKSLNIFNSKYVLAKQETATDSDFLGIESVIAHEYFHNWTGNRVTCRDWFQLTLKEGLTVFRDQQFSQDHHDADLSRLEDIGTLKAGQWLEDNSPMAHSIRPDSYKEINNFYTATVYEKGAEIIRMIHTIIGVKAFRAGMDLYFKRHDGQAVTCEDFVAAMQDASGVDLTQFRLWYSQIGTPQVEVTFVQDLAKQTVTLTFSQDQTPPLHIPIKLALIGQNGLVDHQAIPPMVELKQSQSVLTINGIKEIVVPSVLRGFSAPVRLKLSLDDQSLEHLLKHDNDCFIRWDCGQILATRTILGRLTDPNFDMAPMIEAWGKLLDDAIEKPAFAAEALSLPPLTILGEQLAIFDVDGLYHGRKNLYLALYNRYKDRLLTLHQTLFDPHYQDSDDAINKRRLCNLILSLLSLAQASEGLPLATSQYQTATSMTNRLAALAALINYGANHAVPYLDDFFDRYRTYPLVVNKWLSLQAMADWDDVIERSALLFSHKSFDITEPNKVYALLGGFTSNLYRFHNENGTGYRFLGDKVIALDKFNPQVAARMVRPLIRWRRFSETRQALMKEQLSRLVAIKDLSSDVNEIVGRALE